MKCFFDNRQLAHAPLRELHNGDWAPYAEKPSRARDIAQQLDVLPVRDFGLGPISAVHDGDYLAFLKSAWADWRSSGREGDAIPYVFPVVTRRPLQLDRIDARLGRFAYDAGTPIAEHSWEAAYWSAQTALTALASILDDGNANAFALCRPPGHHAGRDYLGGYCYLSNAAIAAVQARAAGVGSVAILDVDYHHGNGTQDIFYETGDVFFASIHADPATDYPFYWGHRDETGKGQGAGATLNLPLPRGTDWGVYQGAVDDACSAIRARGTQLLIVSFGADTFDGDPISHFTLGREDFRQIGKKIAGLGLPTLIVMEGGYAVDDLGRNVAAFLSGFEA